MAKIKPTPTDVVRVEKSVNRYNAWDTDGVKRTSEITTGCRKKAHKGGYLLGWFDQSTGKFTTDTLGVTFESAPDFKEGDKLVVESVQPQTGVLKKTKLIIQIESIIGYNNASVSGVPQPVTVRRGGSVGTYPDPPFITLTARTPNISSNIGSITAPVPGTVLAIY